MYRELLCSMVHRHRKRVVLPPFYGIPARQQAQLTSYSVGREMISSRVAWNNVKLLPTVIYGNYNYKKITIYKKYNKSETQCTCMDASRNSSLLLENSKVSIRHAIVYNRVTHIIQSCNFYLFQSWKYVYHLGSFGSLLWVIMEAVQNEWLQRMIIIHSFQVFCSALDFRSDANTGYVRTRWMLGANAEHQYTKREHI